MSDSDQIEKKSESKVKAENDKLKVELDDRNESKLVRSFYNNSLIEDYPETFNWRDLFFKLCFEQMIHFFP